MKYTKKETWDRIIEECENYENINFNIIPFLEWLKIKGCQEIFYAFFPLNNLILTKDVEGEKFNDNRITFGFGTKFYQQEILIKVSSLLNSPSL